MKIEENNELLKKIFFDIPKNPNSEFDIVGLGLNAVDHLIEVPKFPEYNTKTKYTKHQMQAGGQTATAMIACGRWGLKTKYIGKIGNDDVGEFAIKSLKNEPVNIDDMKIIDGAFSQLAYVIIDSSNGERTIIWNRDDQLTFLENEINEDMIKHSDILFLDGHSIKASNKALEIAHSNNIKVVADVDRIMDGTYEHIKNIDFLITAQDFPCNITGIKDPLEAMIELQKYTNKYLATTQGFNGVYTVWNDKIYHISGFNIDSKDTTGAGDLFHAGFLYGLSKNMSLYDILVYSNAVAAINCTKIGARGGIVDVKTSENFIQKNGYEEIKIK